MRETFFPPHFILILMSMQVPRRMRVAEEMKRFLEKGVEEKRRIEQQGREVEELLKKFVDVSGAQLRKERDGLLLEAPTPSGIKEIKITNEGILPLKTKPGSVEVPDVSEKDALEDIKNFELLRQRFIEEEDPEKLMNIMPYFLHAATSVVEDAMAIKEKKLRMRDKKLEEKVVKTAMIAMSDLENLAGSIVNTPNVPVSVRTMAEDSLEMIERNKKELQSLYDRVTGVRKKKIARKLLATALWPPKMAARMIKRKMTTNPHATAAYIAAITALILFGGGALAMMEVVKHFRRNFRAIY